MHYNLQFKRLFKVYKQPAEVMLSAKRKEPE